MRNFQSLEVVGHGSETQLQEGESINCLKGQAQAKKIGDFILAS